MGRLFFALNQANFITTIQPLFMLLFEQII